ncbi:MAG: hypothetical protein IKC59_03325 [Clostridia bacterium]|nr:hypothetical protein [Clostridia bacterium]
MRDEKKAADGTENAAPAPQKQKRLFKYRRAGVVLSEDEVKQIKQGRASLRRELRDSDIRNRREFEQMASGMGLYFDKRRGAAVLAWLLHGRMLWAMIGALVSLLTVLFLFSLVSKMKGHFTINMTDELFSEGFAIADVVDDTGDLVNPTSYLFGTPVANAPCTSIAFLPPDLDQVDGSHNGDDHFAYTFYIRNDGLSTLAYEYQVLINSESQDLSRAAWVMLFEDGEMTFYAQATEDDQPEALPPIDDDTRGYRRITYRDVAKYPDSQYMLIDAESATPYYRLVPIPFESESVVTTGTQIDVVPGEMHKYTVVIWREGDDPDCTNDLIGGHFGLEMNFKLLEEDKEKNRISRRG